ncbi:muramoylpentapeptide carboxypeptidase [Nocardioides szechwanensis]|uniref:Zinc D-Ala-D-Ala carboxypeptidase n=2 Tax=Nocardioides szechwanensis TaxID=1005944 RepID=A0A1H0FE85_9ACTN|nr:muramoylpentapeptide carboxypeptidase [Nocardioides szechwanensis]SDN92749.1 zinc D-Ala-D-Ala carboxypeptidase [Nocardioides szechwanensis]
MSRMRASLVAALVTLTSLVALTTATTAPAHADECYSWTRTLSSGATGDDVAQLQVRVAGWAGYGVNIAIDGSYGAQTAEAVRGFQAAYGLSADGVAGAATYAKIYELQDADCTPLHFSYAEVDGGCGAGGYSGGSVSAATVQQNLLRAMWRAEALRHRLGDQPLTVTSGFRSQACDRSVGGSGTGQHTYGTALDLVGSSVSLCTIAGNARYAGFGGIYGPGYPDHDDHVHVDIRAGRSWSAPTCGI